MLSRTTNNSRSASADSAVVSGGPFTARSRSRCASVVEAIKVENHPTSRPTVMRPSRLTDGQQPFSGLPVGQRG